MAGVRGGLKEGRGKPVLICQRHRVVSGYLQMLSEECGFSVPASVNRKRGLPPAVADSHPDIILISDPQPLDALAAAHGVGGHLQIVLRTEGKVPAGDLELRGLGIPLWVPAPCPRYVPSVLFAGVSLSLY